MRNNQQGNALLLVIMVVAVFLGMLALTLDQGSLLFKDVNQASLEDIALNLSEAGLEFAVHKIATTEGEIDGEDDVAFTTGHFSVSIHRLRSSGMVEIYSRGIAANQAQGDLVQRTLKMVVSVEREGAETPLIMHSREEVL